MKSRSRDRQIELRSMLAQQVRAVFSRPTPAAIHEAAHEHMARLAGFDEIFTTVDPGGESGRCYYRSTPTLGRGPDGRVFRSTLSTLRRHARVKLAGGIAEAMLEGRQVPSWGELLTAEGLEPRDAELYEGSVVLPFFAPLVKWHNGNVDAARSSVTRILTESRQETIFDLRNNWPAVLRRARQLDDKWKARTT